MARGSGGDEFHRSGITDVRFIRSVYRWGAGLHVTRKSAGLGDDGTQAPGSNQDAKSKPRNAASIAAAVATGFSIGNR